MAGLAPLDRPDGSTQVLRYRGQIATSADAAATYPKVPATIAANSGIVGNNFVAYVRFPLFDASTPSTPALIANALKRFPEGAFDDSQLAAASPHAPVACSASATPGVNASDLSLNLKTWAQNIDVTVRPLDDKMVVADSGVSLDNQSINGMEVVLDTLTSGMGLNTGLPVLIIQFLVTNANGAIQAFSVDVTIEIRHSASR